MILTEAERAERHNADLFKRLAAAREERGYGVTGAGRGAAVHAAVSTTRGHGGFQHPRSLCQAATPAHYHWLLEDQTAAVTCKRCLASLEKRGGRA